MIIQTRDRHAPITFAFYLDDGEWIDLHSGEVHAERPKTNALYLSRDAVPVKPGEEVSPARYYRHDPERDEFVAVLDKEVIVNLGLWVDWEEDCGSK